MKNIFWRVLLCSLIGPAALYGFASLAGEVRTNEPDTCIQCHGNRIPPAVVPSSITAPDLPDQFSMDWKMFEFTSSQRPPFKEIPEPHSFIPGQSYYDWKLKAMTEVYPEKCIDIFPEGRDYPCQFTSLGNQTFLIRKKTCCRWRSTEFWAPRPDVLKNMVFDQTLNFGGKRSLWWLLDIPLPGPFGYGFVPEDTKPAGFWFPVISGWVQQNFLNIRLQKPDPRYFQLPDSCQNDSPVCEGSDG